MYSLISKDYKSKSHLLKSVFIRKIRPFKGVVDAV